MERLATAEKEGGNEQLLRMCDDAVDDTTNSSGDSNSNDKAGSDLADRDPSSTILINRPSISISAIPTLCNEQPITISSIIAWSRSEDERLKLLVGSLGRKWQVIAEEMRRSPEDVMLRYDFKVAKVKAGSWTRHEDKQLIKYVNM